MKRIVFLSTLVITCLSGQKSSADLLAGWDFAGLTATTAATTTPATISATVGSGTIDISSFGLGSPQGTNPERTVFAGSTLNSFAGGDVTAGMALALANSAANGKSVIFSFNTLGFEDLVLSFATRGTATGFNTHAWAWSTDGVNYTSVVGNTAVTTSTFEIKTVDLSLVSALDNAPTAYLMLTVSGATSASGNNRLDNLQLNATPIVVPEPSAAAIVGGFGLLGLFMAARRRN
jgi:hypothetical protein